MRTFSSKTLAGFHGPLLVLSFLFSGSAHAQRIREDLRPAPRSDPALDWTLGASLMGGQRTTSSESAPATFLSAAGSVSRLVFDSLTASLSGDSQWGEFVGTDRVWQNTLTAPLQTGSESLRFSLIPRLSTQSLAGRIYSVQKDLTADVTFGRPERFYGASLIFGTFQMSDSDYSYLNGPSSGLKAYAGVELLRRLETDVALLAGTTGMTGSYYGIDASAEYTLSQSWRCSLDTTWVHQSFDAVPGTFKSLTAQAGYRINQELSLTLSQYFEANTFQNSLEPLNEMRSLVGFSVALGNS